MPTPYPGRTRDYDLGRGHSAAWAADGTLTERHGYGPSGGWHGFPVDLAGTGALAAGSPDDPARLTIAVQLTCPLCGITGRIISGRWVAA